MKTRRISVVISLVFGLGVAACKGNLHTGTEDLSDAGQDSSTGGLGTGGMGTGGGIGVGGAGGVPTGGMVAGGAIGGGGTSGVLTGGIGSGGAIGGGVGGTSGVAAGGMVMGGNVGGGGMAGSAGSMCNGLPLPANSGPYSVCPPVATEVFCHTCEGLRSPECAAFCSADYCWECGSGGWGLSASDCVLTIGCNAADAGADGSGGSGGSGGGTTLGIGAGGMIGSSTGGSSTSGTGGTVGTDASSANGGAAAGSGDSGLTGGACSETPIDASQAAAAYTAYRLGVQPDLGPSATFVAEELNVPGLWEALQAQLFAARWADDTSSFQVCSFLYRHCEVTVVVDGNVMFGQIVSGVVANGALYYSWQFGSGIYYSSIGKVAADSSALVQTAAPAYMLGSPPPLVLEAAATDVLVYRALTQVFNVWSTKELFGTLKDYGDRLAILDSNGLEIPGRSH